MSQNSRIALVYNLTGQEVQFYVPEDELRRYGTPASAATYAVWRGTDANDQPSLLSGTATLDTVSTTINTATGVSQTNKRKIFLASTASITAGRSFVLANVGTQREIVTPWDVQTTFVQIWNDLAYDYPITTSTFKGLRHSFVIDATFIATISNINALGALYFESRYRPQVTNYKAPPYRVRWSYTTADGIARQAWTYFDVVRQNAKHNVTANDIRELFPDISEREWREQRGSQFAAQLDAAWDRLVVKVKACGYDIDQMRDQPVVDELTRLLALQLIAEAGVIPNGRDTETYIRERRETFTDLFNAVIGSTMKAYIDTGVSGNINPDPPRSTRLRR